ncbi:MAG: YceI family protein [Bacteroidetes bacterium]|nr:YceI family protein [Bacteroidota bacterium]
MNNLDKIIEEEHISNSEMNKSKILYSADGCKRLILFYNIFIISFLMTFQGFSQPATQYFIQNSTIRFVSNASLERIEAVSTELRGIIDISSNSFAFSVNNTSFRGFNSQLQEEHFNENYLESGKHPKCTFSGKIIDDIDFNKDGTYIIRAKGILNVKGIGQERIIKSTVAVKGKEVFISGEFVILLADHEIRIPRIVQQKIAPEIEVRIQAKLVGGEKQ